MEDSPAVVGLLGATALGSLLVWIWVLPRAVARGEIVPYEPREPVPWTGLDLGVILGIFIVAIAIAANIAFALGLLIDASAGGGGITVGGIGMLLGSALAIAYLRFKCEATWLDLGIVLGKLKRDVPLGVAIYLAAALPVYGLMLLLTQMFDYTHPLVKLFGEKPDMLTLGLAAASAVILAPLTEEFLFRVLLQGWFESLKKRRKEPVLVLTLEELALAEPARTELAPAVLSPTVPTPTPTLDEPMPVLEMVEAAPSRPSLLPIIASSLIFALVHLGNGPDQLPLFLFALFLGYAYRQTHRLAPSVVAHLCLNLTSVVQLWMMTQNAAS